MVEISKPHDRLSSSSAAAQAGWPGLAWPGVVLSVLQRDSQLAADRRSCVVVSRLALRRSRAVAFPVSTPSRSFVSL